MTAEQPASVYLELRDAITRIDPHAQGFAPSVELPHVWGALIDVGMGAGPVTIVSIVDGTTSLYLGNGAATVGAGGAPPVADATRQLLIRLDAALPHLAPTWEYPVPEPDRVHVIALTYQGMFGAWADAAELVAGGHPLSGVFAAATSVLTQVQRLEAAIQPDPDTSGS